MRIFVIGGSGFLGRELVRQCLLAGYEVAASYFTRPVELTAAEVAEVVQAPRVAWHRLDIRSGPDVTELLERLQPDIVLNAAYRQSDWTTTAEGPAHIALAAVGGGVRLVHVSSDAVFSGKDITYPEISHPDPISPYGAAKAAAETALRVIAPLAVIARTSLILGDGGSPQEALVHDLASGRRQGALFTDDVRCPVHVADLASALLELAVSERFGVHHVAGTDPISRYELGLLVAERDRLDPAALPTGRRAETNVPGPYDVRLDCGITQQGLRTRLRGAREFLRVETTDTRPVN